jgi:hypothetical protein
MAHAAAQGSAYNGVVSAKPRRVSRLFVIVAVVVLTAVIGAIAAVVISIRVETGTWRVPETSDFVRIARRFDTRPSKTIFLERNSVELRPGEDDAARGVSSVLLNATNKPVRSKSWSGGDKKWKSLVTCVQKLFSPFDVVVTDQRPSHDDFMMAVVGGKPADIGIKDSHHVSGLAPFHGGVIPRAIVYAFSATNNNDVRATCETVGMEVAHAYGLDHEYLCKDIMTYLRGCGAKTFVDADAPCGEGKKRTCEGGAATQNSYRRLVEVLGAARPQTATTK